MKDLFSYLKKYKDTSFDLLPFNDIDAAILTSLTYLNLESFLVEDKNYSFFSIINQKNRKELLIGALMPHKDSRLITILSQSLRYQNLLFSGSLFVEKPEELIQFFSVNIIDPGKRNFICFRGTNTTIYGWLEDLLFGTVDGPGSLIYAKRFIQKVISANSLPVILLGHSKGGTLAECTYRLLEEEQKSRIQSIYNFDGPGFRIPYSSDELIDFQKKSKKWITKRTVFGLLLFFNHSYTIIDSKGFWIPHHMLYSWKVNGIQFVQSLKTEKRSWKRRQIMNDFVLVHTDEELKKIIQDCAFLMQESEIDKAKDISLSKAIKLMKSYSRGIKIHEFHPDFKEFLTVCRKAFL